MNTIITKTVFTATSLFLFGCGGSDSNSTTEAPILNPTPPAPSVATFSLGLSDAPVDDAVDVTIELESITLKNSEDSSETVIETFTDMDGMEVETIQVNLLEYQGSSQVKIIDEAQNIELETGIYEMELNVIDAGSYVLLDNDDTSYPIKVPSSRLRLGEFSVNETAEQENDTPAYTVEFDLRQSLVMRGNINNNNGFIIKPHGVRIVSLAGGISGTVAPELTNLGECNVYLYDDEVTEYGDMFDPEDEDFEAPDDEITASAPLATTKVALDGTYSIGFLQPDTYQVALTCGVAMDDNIQFDGLTIPSAADITPEVMVVDVASGETKEANF